MRRKMDKKKRKMDKFAIGSFVLALVPFVLWIILSVIQITIIYAYNINSKFGYYLSYNIYTIFIVFVLSFILVLLSLALGIISLRRIKNNSLLKGKVVAIVGLIISGLEIVAYLLYLLLFIFTGAGLIA